MDNSGKRVREGVHSDRVCQNGNSIWVDKVPGTCPRHHQAPRVVFVGWAPNSWQVEIQLTVAGAASNLADCQLSVAVGLFVRFRVVFLLADFPRKQNLTECEFADAGVEPPPLLLKEAKG